MRKKHKSLQASPDGVALIRKACESKGWIWDAGKNDHPLIEASKHIEPGKAWPIRGALDNIYADGIHEGSWRRFLKGEKVPVQVFMAYCYALDLAWECVVDLNQIDAQLPFNLPKFPKAEDQPKQDASRFVQDVTVPDGSIFKPNEKFLKIWEVCNSGNVSWENRYLTRIGMNNGAGLIISPRRVRIAKTFPGQNVQIKVELQAPEAGGTYQAIWKMTFADGTLCFPNNYKYGLFVTINVIQ
jgi:hypothetical protein